MVTDSFTPYASVGAALAAQAQARPKACGLSFPRSGGTRSFEEWEIESRRLAGALIGLGIRPGSHVALLAENRVEWPIVQLAVALAGAVLVPINTHFAVDDLRYVLARSSSSCCRGFVRIPI